MKEQVLDETVARQFLLGQLPDEQEARIQELAFDDPESFEFLQVAEAELIEEYVYEELSTVERDQFVSHFLPVAGRKNDVKLARALKESLGTTRPEVVVPPPVRVSWFQTFSFRLAFAALLLIVAAVVIWLALRANDQPTFRVRDSQPSPAPSLAPSRELQASASPTPGPSPLPVREVPQPRVKPASSIFTVLLAPSISTRSESNTTPIELHSAAEISFVLLFKEKKSYESFDATLENDGVELTTKTGLRSGKSSRQVQLTLPAQMFEVGKTYRIRLAGVSADKKTDLYDYRFNVVK